MTLPTQPYELLGDSADSRSIVMRALVADFYDRVQRDVFLLHHFAPLMADPRSMARLRAHVAETLAALLGHPGARGWDMRAAHAGLQITIEDYWRLASHLLATFDQARIHEEVFGVVAHALYASSARVRGEGPL